MMTRLKFARAGSFWLLATLLALLSAASSAPSPLYAVYAARWHFSSITLTAIFGVYALALLAALLTTGRLSDYLGRRAVMLLALLVLLAGVLAFIVASSVAWLFAARILQGLGTGMAAGAISAWLVDLQPPDRPGLGSLVGSVAPISGLAAGTLGAGLLVQYGPDPLHLVYWVLLALFVLALASMPFLPDVTERRPGWLASMQPHIGVPRAARSLFAASMPSLIATWALSALYLSLGPELALSLLHSDSTLAGALVIVALMGPGALAAALLHAAEPRLLEIRSLFVLIVGVGITLLAVALGSPVGLYAGSVIAGIGYTPAFSAVFRSLVPLAPPDKRAELIASIYVVAYLAFSLPAIIAGVAVTHYSLRETTYVYGLVVMALSAITAVVLWRRRASPRAAAGAGR
jgi:MFS family permease